MTPLPRPGRLPASGRHATWVMTLVASILVGLFVQPSESILYAGSPLADGTHSVSPADIQQQSIPFVLDAARGRLNCSIVVDGAEWTLDLQRTTLRSDDFRLLLIEDDGARELSPPPSNTFQGTIAEFPDYRVRATYRDHELTALIFPRDAEGRALETSMVAVQPACSLGLDPVDGTHVVYLADAVHDTIACAGTIGGASSAAIGQASFEADQFLCELAFDSDYEYYLTHGADPFEALEEIETIANCLIPFYEVTDIAITFEMTSVLLRGNSSDPYASTDPADLLQEFEDAWEIDPADGIVRDAAHLLTGRKLDGGTVGIAALGTVCGVAPYSLSEPGFSDLIASKVALVAHEIGHTFNAGHCDTDPDCQVMCSVIGGCSGVTDAFAAESADSIATARDDATCLDELEGPQLVPFEENFDSGSLSIANWLHVKGASVSAAAVAEPSGFASLRLGAFGDGRFEFHEVRSNRILMADLTAPVLEYAYQSRDTEIGEELIVEFLNSDLEWEELIRHDSTGESDEEFHPALHYLPENALHDWFRLRLRVDADDDDDAWYVDSIRIDESIDESPVIVGLVPPVGSTDGGYTTRIFGAQFVPDSEVSLDGVALETEVISRTELRVTVPARDEEGAVAIEIDQPSGTTTLNDGFHYANDVLSVGETTASGGDIAEVPVTASHTFDVTGFTFTVDFAPDQLSVVDFEFVSSISSLGLVIANADEGWCSVAILSSAPSTVILPAGDNLLGTLSVEVQPTSGTASSAPITFSTDDVNELSGPTLSVTPYLDSGEVLILGAPASTFIRGDADLDLDVTVLDVIEILDFIFGGGTLGCLDAADVNDDSAVRLLDAVTLLQHLFSSDIWTPAAPYPDPGTDPTPDDGLGCS